MSEAWAICFATAAFAFLAWGVNRIASKIDALTDKLNELSMALNACVTQAACAQSMGAHCQRLTDLEKQVKSNTQQLAIMEKKK